MPFQSEKQRRSLHANHPEIAKRWEKEYASGGITLPKGPAGITSLNGWGSKDSSQNKAGADISASMDKNPNDPGWGGGGNGGGPKPHSGPTLAEIEAQKKAKALADANAKAELEAAKHKAWIDRKDKKKKKVKHHKTLTSKFDTPEWDTDLTTFSLEDFKSTKTLEDYYRQLDETDVPLSVFEKQHMEVLENQNKLKFEDEFKEKEGISDEKLMYPPPGNLAKVDKSQYNMLKALGQVGNTGGSADEIKQLVPAGTFDSITDKEWDQIFSGKKFKEIKQGAKGGLARKNYFHGGILGLNESEEFISDDGNDIELTDYNAAFDDPNDLSTGVKSLFRAKNGGSYAMQGGVKNYLGDQEMVNAPKHWQSAPNHPETELTYITKPEKDLLVKADLHGSLKDGPNTGPEGLMSLDSQGDKGTYGQTGQSYGDRQTSDTSPEVGDAPSKQDLQEYKENRAIREANQKAADDAKKASEDLSFEDKWGKWNDKYDKLNKYSFTAAGVKKRAKLIDQNYNEDRAALEKKFGKNLITKIAMAFLGMPISIGYSDIKAVKSMYDLQKKYKADMQNLKDISIDKGWADFHHAVDTPMQTIDQLMMDTIKVRDEDDTGGDGPEVPKVVPVHQEIEAYEDVYAMSPWDRIKANQQKRAMLVEKGIIQENPIVDESVTDITMEANKGGLANLFRVKNQ